MFPVTRFMMEAARKASKLLLRDYYELEHLQSSTRGGSDFARRSCVKTYEVLSQELLKYPNARIAETVDTTDLDQKSTVYVLHAIDAAQNLTRAIPFFGMSIMCYQNRSNALTPISCVIVFPALSEIIYAEQGNGVWKDKMDGNSSRLTRLRVASKKNATSVILADGASYNISDGEELRCSGSWLYDLSLIVSGKADVCVFKDTNHRLLATCNMVVAEAGGVVEHQDGNIILTARR